MPEENLKIYGSKLLRKKCEEVTVFDDELAKFAEKLRGLMYELDGVGLAAVQIGKPLRIAAVCVPDTENESVILINPKIVWKSQDTQTDSEGCLSIPDIRANVTRPMSVTVESVSEKGIPVVFENVSGFFARAIQHEIDHMDGVLFVDKIDPIKKTLIAGKLKKIAKEHKDK